MTMTSADVAREIGTDAKTLRRFLRTDPTFNNPGSGGRYDFQPSDIPAVRKRFAQWAANKKPVATPPTTATPLARVNSGRRTTQSELDAAVWAEEEAERVSKGLGPIEVPRTPTRKMRADALEQVKWLEARLRETGRHVSQIGTVDDWRHGSRGPYERKVSA